MDGPLPASLDPLKTGIWSIRVPPGNSSPVIVGGRLFLTGHEGDQRLLLCLDAATGKELWRKSVPRGGERYFHKSNGPTTPSPATDGRNIFVFFPDFGLLAHTIEGRELWRTPLAPSTSVQGLAASPIYADHRVILPVDTPEESYLVAFDAATGRQSWRVERPTGVLGAYTTPATAQIGESTLLIVAGAMELTAYQASTGERIWWALGVTEFPTGPPFVSGDSVYTVEPSGVGWPAFQMVLDLFDKDKDGIVTFVEAAGDQSWLRSLKGIDRNVGNRDEMVTAEEYARASAAGSGGLVRTRLGGSGDVTATHVVWRQQKGMPALTGALLYDSTIYVLRFAIVSTYDPETGALLRQERVKDALGEYWASPVAGDGKIYIVSLEGKASVLKAGRNWNVLSTTDLGGQVIATPAISNGRVYVRTEKTLHCFGGRASVRAGL
jgi:outer membrane protein assembly factor BamB